MVNKNRLAFLQAIPIAVNNATNRIAVKTGRMQRSVRDELIRQLKSGEKLRILEVMGRLDQKTPYHTVQHGLFRFHSGYKDRSKRPIDTVIIISQILNDLKEFKEFLK